jgi:GTP pyrophosphokinase
MGKLSELIEKNKRLEDHFNNNQREHLSGIYKMLISVTEDVRVVLIKLAERTLAYVSWRRHLKNVRNV